jgi:hypothetical protein
MNLSNFSNLSASLATQKEDHEAAPLSIQLRLHQWSKNLPSIQKEEKTSYQSFRAF